MSNTVTFTYPKGPQDVIVTGDFDQWNKTLPLVKQSDGSFQLTMPIPHKAIRDHNKLFFKFVVDGQWVVSDHFPSCSSVDGDASIVNNYFEINEESKRLSSFIPESALPMAVTGNRKKIRVKRRIRKNKKTGEETIISEEKEVLEDYNTTTDGEDVVSKDVTPLPAPVSAESAPVSKLQEAASKTPAAIAPLSDIKMPSLVGEPGIVIPENAKDIKELKDVKKDTKVDEPVFTTLPIVPEPVAKTSLAGEPGIVIPKNAKDIKEFSEVSKVDQKELNDKLNKNLETKEKEATKDEPVFTTLPIVPEPVAKTSLAGEPGIAIPKNAKDIKEFSEVSKVDQKELSDKLNEKLETVEQKITKDEPVFTTESVVPEPIKTSLVGNGGVAIPDNAKIIKEFSEITNVDEQKLNEKSEKDEPAFVTKPIVPESTKTSLAGEPGIAVPEKAKDIKEFSEISNVDQKELSDKLNEKLETAEQKITKDEPIFNALPIVPEPIKASLVGEPGIAIPEKAKDIKEFSEISNVDQKELSDKLNSQIDEAKDTVQKHSNAVAAQVAAATGAATAAASVAAAPLIDAVQKTAAVPAPTSTSTSAPSETITAAPVETATSAAKVPVEITTASKKVEEFITDAPAKAASTFASASAPTETITSAPADEVTTAAAKAPIEVTTASKTVEEIATTAPVGAAAAPIKPSTTEAPAKSTTTATAAAPKAAPAAVAAAVAAATDAPVVSAPKKAAPVTVSPPKKEKSGCCIIC